MGYLDMASLYQPIHRIHFKSYTQRVNPMKASSRHPIALTIASLLRGKHIRCLQALFRVNGVVFAYPPRAAGE